MTYRNVFLYLFQHRVPDGHTEDAAVEDQVDEAIGAPADDGMLYVFGSKTE